MDFIGIIVFCGSNRGINVAYFKVCGNGRGTHIDFVRTLNLMNPVIVFLGIIHRPVFYLKHTTFRSLDSVWVFRWNLHSWTRSIELVPISEGGHRIQSPKRRVLNKNTGRWIMSRNTIIILIYHLRKLLDLILMNPGETSHRELFYSFQYYLLRQKRLIEAWLEVDNDDDYPAVYD
jgi:hypothetical protein